MASRFQWAAISFLLDSAGSTLPNPDALVFEEDTFLIMSTEGPVKSTSRSTWQLIRDTHPKANSILDVACGTAEHAKLLSRNFQVDGIDLDEESVENHELTLYTHEQMLDSFRTVGMRV